MFHRGLFNSGAGIYIDQCGPVLNPGFSIISAPSLLLPLASPGSLVFHVGYIITKTKEHPQMRSCFFLFKPDELLMSLRIINL